MNQMIETPADTATRSHNYQIAREVNRPDSIRIDWATADDIPTILRFIQELQDYQKMGGAVTATEASLREHLFGPKPLAEVLLATSDTEPVGFAFFFQAFSSVLGAPSLFLDDLYVVPGWRARGVGRALLSRLAAVASERKCGRLEWMVLNRNAPAIGFYRQAGAHLMTEWTKCRMSRDEIQALAGQ